MDNDYVNHYLTAGLNLVLGQRLLLRASADYTCYRGITDPFREERLICNLQAGCKLFRQRLGEVTVGVNDLFDRAARRSAGPSRAPTSATSPTSVWDTTSSCSSPTTCGSSRGRVPP